MITKSLTLRGAGPEETILKASASGFPYDAFTGSVIFEGTNIIEGNNRWGNQKGMGNPGNHPFKGLPDGQVCLP